MEGDTLRLELVNKIKIHLAIKDDIQDDLILNIVDGVIDNYYLLYSEQPSYKHLFILESIAVKRYNRRKAEGLTSQSYEGYSASYTDETKDFTAYDDIIRKDLGIYETGIQFL